MLFIDIELLTPSLTSTLTGEVIKRSLLHAILDQIDEAHFLAVAEDFLRISSGALPSMVNRSRATPTAVPGSR